MLAFAAASASSFALGRAVAATVTPAAASRFAISPQMAPEAPVIQAIFQGNLSCHPTSPRPHTRPSHAATSPRNGNQ